MYYGPSYLYFLQVVNGIDHTMKENLRYTGDPERLYDFMDEFTVHCHKCDGKAEVSIPSHFDYKNAVLKVRLVIILKKQLIVSDINQPAKQNVINVWSF